MGDDSAIERHLRSGQDRLARISEAVTAFRRLAPTDYGHFLATIEADLGTCPPDLLGSVVAPLLLASPAAELPPVTVAKAPKSAKGSLREIVLGLLADGRARSTLEIRREVETRRPVKPATLNTEIFTLRKLGRIRSEGQGRGRRHTLIAAAAPKRAVAGKREATTRAPKRKRDDDEDHPAPAPGRTSSPDAERIYGAAISGHHLLAKDEELALAQRLEEVEISLWTRLLGGELAAETRKLLLEHDPPIESTRAVVVRAADPDRLIASRVIGNGDQRPSTAEHATLRSLAAEADRIRDHFATCNLRLVPSTIRRHGYHLTTGLAMSDLIQEGNFGLLKAIPRYDYRRGLRFSTFATWWIRHYLVRARQNLGAEVRVPVHLQDLAAKARRAKIKLKKELGRDPSRDELAADLKVAMKSLLALEQDWPKYREALPVADSVGEEGTIALHLTSDAPLADEIIMSRQDDDQLVAAIGRIPPLLAKIVRRRFGFDGGEPETLIQIGESMQLSRERIRQLEKQALTILRARLVEVTGVAA